MSTKEELETEIQELRHELGETVEALSERLDVKARLREKASHVPVAPIAIATVVLVAVVIWRKRS